MSVESSGTENLLIPAEFYFQASIEIPRLSDLREQIEQQRHPNIPHHLPQLSFSRDERCQIHAALAWNDQGLCFQCEIHGKNQPVVAGSAHDPEQGDHLELFLDTRDMKSNRRANRFCHRFLIRPPANKQLTQLIPAVMSGGRYDQQLPASEEFPTLGTKIESGYRISCWIPGELLEGYDPEHVPSLGGFYQLHDQELGVRRFGVGPKFPVTSDPSLWASFRLVDQLGNG